MGAGEPVTTGVVVGAGVDVFTGVFVSAMTVWVGFSMSTGGSIGDGACVAAAPPQEVIKRDRNRITINVRTIETHFRIHAGQQAGSLVRAWISPEAMSAICTSILPSRTVLKVRVFPSGDQCGVSARPFVKDVICLSSPLWTFTR